MIRPTRRPLLFAAVTALSLTALSLSVVQISRFIRFGDVIHLAARLDRGEPVVPATVSGATVWAQGVMDDGICQHDFIKSALTVLLTDLDHQDQDRDYEGWARSLDRAEGFARFALGCAPTDGDLWLRLAMVQQAIGEQSQEIARLITFSQLYAPAEGNVIAGRYRLYNRLTPATLSMAANTVAADFVILCSPTAAHLRRRLPPPSNHLAPFVVQRDADCAIGLPR